MTAHGVARGAGLERSPGRDRNAGRAVAPVCWARGTELTRLQYLRETARKNVRTGDWAELRHALPELHGNAKRREGKGHGIVRMMAQVPKRLDVDLPWPVSAR